MVRNYMPIGVFDSGLGGLTVVKEIIRILPNEDIVYFGDTAHLPYGTKSKETVTRLSINNVKFLSKHKIKMLVVACNTASALSLQRIKKEVHFPVIGVIEPGVKAALNATKNRKIGVIGTISTVKSNAYYKTIKNISQGIRVFNKACPLFVPLVEEGWLNKKVTYLIAEEYLKPFKQNRIDTLILGCTHYPLLKKVINTCIGNKVNLIDSAEAVALEVKGILVKNNLICGSSNRKGKHRFFVSDLSPQFKKIASGFLGDKLKDVKVVK